MDTTEGEIEAAGFAPVLSASGKPVELAMQKLMLTGRVLPVGARVFVCHSFASAEKDPVEVVYCFALPRDAALRRFQISGRDFSVRSELKPTEEASTAYEEGLSSGHLSTLARQYRDGMVNLSVGNLRKGDEVTVWLEILAGVELRDDGLRFRFPFTLAPSYHSRARSASVEGVGEIELPEDEFGDILLPAFRADAQGLHQVGFDLTLRDTSAALAEIASPSHAIRVRSSANSESRVSLAVDADVPNRDLVLDVKTRDTGARILAGTGTDHKGHFAALVPSTYFGDAPREPRTVVFLLDRSGSMQGVPIDQARKALVACLATLTAEDRFGVVAFDNEVDSFAPQLVPATSENRVQAQAFLAGIHARGGTELAAGVEAAKRLLQNAQGDIVVLTDGQVFGTEDILKVVRATGVRLHCLGIGSASQDRFLTLLARETGGVSRFATPRERVDLAALELFSSISHPVASNLQVDVGRLASAVLQPMPQQHVFKGTPLLILGECEQHAEGSLSIAWDSAGGAHSTDLPVKVGPDPVGNTLRLLRGSRLITDLESRLPDEFEATSAERRTRSRFLEQLESLSRTYGLASQAMALVAIVERPADQPGLPPATRIVPVGMPVDTSFEDVFQPTHRLMLARTFAPSSVIVRCMSMAEDMMDALAGPPPGESRLDRAVELAATLEPDGGMPGNDLSERILNTLLALLVLVAVDRSLGSSPFRRHREKMTGFLKDQLPGPLAKDRAEIAAQVLEVLGQDQPVDSSWADMGFEELLKAGGRPKATWKRLSKEFHRSVNC